MRITKIKKYFLRLLIILAILAMQIVLVCNAHLSIAFLVFLKNLAFVAAISSGLKCIAQS